MTSEPRRVFEYSETIIHLKIKIRYLVEKKIEGEWVLMARLTEDPERVEDLCWALGGLIRVKDLLTGGVCIPEKDFE